MIVSVWARRSAADVVPVAADSLLLFYRCCSDMDVDLLQPFGRIPSPYRRIPSFIPVSGSPVCCRCVDQLTPARRCTWTVTCGLLVPRVGNWHVDWIRLLLLLFHVVFRFPGHLAASGFIFRVTLNYSFYLPLSLGSR